MKKTLLFTLILITSFSLAQEKYHIYYDKGMISFSKEILEIKNSISITLPPPKSEIEIEIELLESKQATKTDSEQQKNYVLHTMGDRKPLGVESLGDFNKNKDSLISKYSEIIGNRGWGDSSITYEVYDDRIFSRSYVKFFLYYGNRIISQSTKNNTSQYSLNEGIHIIEIWNEKEFIKSFYLLIGKEGLEKYPIDYKL